MRFGIVHRLMTSAVAVLGILSIVTTATLGPLTNMVVLVGLFVALAIPEKVQLRPTMRHVTTGAVLVLFFVQITRIFAGASALETTVEFAVLLQIVRVATRRGAAHDQQIIVLSLLHFVAGTVLGGTVAYGLCFAGFLLVVPGALVLSHLRREVEGNYRQGARDRTGLPVDVPRILRSRRVIGRNFLVSTCLLSLPIFLFTALLFVLFPRVGLSLLMLNHSPRGRMVGFSDHVDLGQVGTLRSDPTLALRFEVPTREPPPTKMTLRLRGTAFDTYDGRAWTRSAVDRVPSKSATELYMLERRVEPGDVRVTFDLEPIDPPVLFLPQRAVAIEVKMPAKPVMGDPISLSFGSESEIRYGGPDVRGLRYDVWVAPDRGAPFDESLSPKDRERYLLRPKLSPRLRKLAHEWTDAEPTPFDKARVLEEHLKTGFRYDASAPSGGTADPLDHFLFESRGGHCEFFSSAMAMMLRELGIPSRNVTGFVGGTYNRFGKYYAVREGDAHSWVEAYVEAGGHRGWLTFDPTPSAGSQPFDQEQDTLTYFRDVVEAMSQRWNQYVVGYDLRKQVHLAEQASNHYENFRQSMGWNRGPLERVTRGPVMAVVLALLGLGAYRRFLRKRRVAKGDDRNGGGPQKDRNAELATTLYRKLEHALVQQGVMRPSSSPPLGFAENLRSHGHPLATPALELTQIYLRARFGRESLSQTDLRAFEARLKEIMEHRPPVDAPP